MRRYSSRQIARTLRKYDTAEVEVAVRDDLRLRMVETVDTYALLDRLIQQEEAAPGVAAGPVVAAAPVVAATSSAAGTVPVAQAGRRATRFPYWAEIWPASLGLARWFASTGEPAPGYPPKAGRCTARELGCGLGLVGIALARLGWRVEATDFVEDALVLTAHNARRNGVSDRHWVSYLDWNHPVGTACDCLVGADVAYERALHPKLERTVGALLLPGGRAIFSDPGRPVAQSFFDALGRSGFAWRRDAVAVHWKALDHRIDVHTFIAPG